MFNKLIAKLGISKKGIMFTVLSVLMCLVIVAAFFTFYSLPLDQNVDSAKIRIDSINNHIDLSEVYIGNILVASSSDSLRFLTEYMSNTTKYFPDFTAAFMDCMLIGSTKNSSGSQIVCSPGSYFIGRLSLLNNFSQSQLTIQENIAVTDLEITQESPWELSVEINYTMIVNDSYAFWNVSRVIKRNVTIMGLYDPTYVCDVASDLSDARYKITISKASPSILPGSFGYKPMSMSWSEANSSAHMLTVNKQYFEWDDAPSYWNRLNNDMSRSACCGIVSIVPGNISNKPGLRSNLDFMFWKNLSINASDYLRYDFWAPKVTDDNRTYYGVSNINPGLNGTIISKELIGLMNMSNPVYLMNVSTS